MSAPFQPTLFVPLTGTMRARIEATIEQLTALLDEIDGDPDYELDDDLEDDDPEEFDDPSEDGDTDEDDYRDIYEEWVRHQSVG